MFHMAESFCGLTLSLEDLPEGHNRSNILAYINKLLFFLLCVQGELRIEPRIDVQLEVFTFDFLGLPNIFDILHMRISKLSPFRVVFPIIIDVVNEISTVALKSSFSLLIVLLRLLCLICLRHYIFKF